MFIKRPEFFQVARLALNYKRQLALALVGVLISATTFGASFALMIPVMNLFFRQNMTLPRIAEHYLLQPDRPAWMHDLANQIIPYLPTSLFGGFLASIGAIMIVSTIGSAGRYLHEAQTVTVALRVTMIWRQRLFCRALHAPLERTFKEGVSDYQSRIMVDVAQIQRAYRSLLGRAVTETANGLVALLTAMLLNPLLTIVTLIGAPLLLVMLNRFGRVIRRATRSALQQQGRLLGVLKEALGAMTIVKTHDAEGYERRRFRRVNKAAFAEQMRLRQAQVLAGPAVELFIFTGVFIIAGIAGWYLFVYRPEADRTTFIVTLAALGFAANSAKQLTGLNNHVREAAASSERIMQAYRTPVEPIDPAVRQALPDLPRHARQVVFEAISYRYPGQERPAIDNINLSVAHGQTLALVGGNGSGKTTLVSLLPRLLLPQSGRVLIDDVDIAAVNIRSLRGQIALVSQQSVLFAGTIAENIAYGRHNEPRDRIIEAAEAAFADEFIRDLPHGYDSRLGEDGVGLSGGQRQRLCIARAILRNPAILILDEATSQVDADSEAKISQAIAHLRQGRTTFVIAHRLSTVVDADCIVVMDDGHVIDQGKHDELLLSCSRYKILAQRQLKPARA